MGIGLDTANSLLAAIKGTPAERAEMADVINVFNSAAYSFDMDQVAFNSKLVADNAAAFAASRAADPVVPPVTDVPPVAPDAPVENVPTP